MIVAAEDAEKRYMNDGNGKKREAREVGNAKGPGMSRLLEPSSPHDAVQNEEE